MNYISKLTNEEFLERLKSIQPQIIPLEEYNGATTKIHCTCSIHGGDIYNTPTRLYQGHGCRVCNGSENRNNIKHTNESFEKRLAEVNPYVKMRGRYTGLKNKVPVQCVTCGYEWETVAKNLIYNKYGCPKCAGVLPMTDEEYRSQLAVSHPELTLLNTYVRSTEKVHCLCSICNKDFWIMPQKLRQGHRCPNCSISLGERKIQVYLDSAGVEYEMHKTYDGLVGLGGRKLSYDFYLPKYNILIEYQGVQHDNPILYSKKVTWEMLERYEKQFEHDKRKREYASANNIDLVLFWHEEFKRIEEKLEHLLDRCEKKLSA